MPIKRFFSAENLERIKRDFDFLLSFVTQSYGEYDFAIRDNYFNLYYKGYSIGKIEPIKDGEYRATIHNKFFYQTNADKSGQYLHKKPSGNYWTITLQPRQLHSFFQKRNIVEFASKVRNEGSGEIEFEQSLITDNLENKDIIIIDRQITDTQLKRRRMDLLALKRIEGNKYQFLIIEVKLGNNTELQGEVVKQLQYYIDHIIGYIKEYKYCYVKHFKQKVELGLIRNQPEIEIIESVSGKIVVGSYYGIAKPKVDALRNNNQNLDIKQFQNAL